MKDCAEGMLGSRVPHAGLGGLLEIPGIAARSGEEDPGFLLAVGWHCDFDSALRCFPGKGQGNYMSRVGF